MGRHYGFIACILLGLVLGMVFGWFLVPMRTPQTSLPDLRADYRLDYVLMVAEAYQADGDVNLAAQRLSQVDEGTPFEIVSQAYDLAIEANYTVADRTLLEKLGYGLSLASSALPTATLEATP